MIQDIPSTMKEPIQHSQKVDRSRETHWVTLDKESKLYQIFGEESVRVNSLHHQALDRIANDLNVVAKATDGIIEAVEYAHSPFAIGVQWHPESLASSNPLMNKLFTEFIQEAISYRQ